MRWERESEPLPDIGPRDCPIPVLAEGEFELNAGKRQHQSGRGWSADGSGFALQSPFTDRLNRSPVGVTRMSCGSLEAVGGPRERPWAYVQGFRGTRPRCPAVGPPKQTRVVGNRRTHQMNERFLAESLNQSTHTMFRTPVPATYWTSSFARSCRHPSGLYDQPILASAVRPLAGSRVIWNRVPSRVIESSPFPERRAESARGLR